MSLKKKRLQGLFFLLSLMLVLSCRKEEDANPLMPAEPWNIVQATLTFGHLVASDNLQISNDSLLIYYYQQDTVFRFTPGDYFTPYSIPEYSNLFKLGVIELPEFSFEFGISLDTLLPDITPAAGDTLAYYDSTVHIFPEFQLENTFVLNGEASPDYTFLGLKTGGFSIVVNNTLPVALKNVHFQLKDIQYNSVVKEVVINSIEPGESYTDFLSLAGRKFSNRYGVILTEFSSKGSGEEELLINLQEGLMINLILQNATTFGGFARVNTQLIGTQTKWIDLSTIAGQKFYSAIYPEGNLILSVEGMKHVDLAVKFELPSVNQNQTSVTGALVAEHSKLSSYSKTINEANFDFTTHLLKPYSRLPLNIEVYLLASDSIILIDSSDIALVNLAFGNFPTAFVEGHFGKKILQSTTEIIEIDLGFVKQMNAEVSFTEPSVFLNYANSIGASVKILPEIKTLNSFTTELATLNTDSLKINYPVLPELPASELVMYDINNSNVAELFENHPDKLLVKIDGRTNWNGQDYNFAWDTSSFYGNINLKLPLIVKTDHLRFMDSVKLEFPKQSMDIQSGLLSLRVINGFPFSMNLSLKLIENLSGNILDSLDFGLVESAILDNTGKVTQTTQTIKRLQAESSFFQHITQSKSGVLILETSDISTDSLPLRLYSNYKTEITITVVPDE